MSISGGTDYADHKPIWAVLDNALAKHADLVLIHRGTPKKAKQLSIPVLDHREGGAQAPLAVNDLTASNRAAF